MYVYQASRVEGEFGGLRVLADGAEGSAPATGGGCFFLLIGLEAELIHRSPDGVNINDGCGSTHVEALAARVAEEGFDLGLAFDGDADRLLAVDEKGRVLDGDHLMAILAEDMRRRGVLKKDTIVVTSMTNLGFFHFASRRGYHCEVTGVGDRYVLDRMRAGGYNLGGEQSGP
jgi:phosphoglucosamine mutase